MLTWLFYFLTERRKGLIRLQDTVSSRWFGFYLKIHRAEPGMAFDNSSSTWEVGAGIPAVQGH